MSLMRMGADASDSVRFMDDVDLTLSLDSRSSSSQRSTSLDVSAKPIVFRASYRDINLITTIVNRALELYGRSTQSTARDISTVQQSNFGSTKRPVGLPIRRLSRHTGQEPESVGHARVVISQEQASKHIPPTAITANAAVRVQFRGSFDGLRLVLIGDLHEQPLLHIKVKPFILGAKDWSGEVGVMRCRRLTADIFAVAGDVNACSAYELLEHYELALGATYVCTTMQI